MSTTHKSVTQGSSRSCDTHGNSGPETTMELKKDPPETKATPVTLTAIAAHDRSCTQDTSGTKDKSGTQATNYTRDTCGKNLFIQASTRTKGAAQTLGTLDKSGTQELMAPMTQPTPMALVVRLATMARTAPVTEPHPEPQWPQRNQEARCQQRHPGHQWHTHRK